ncbi:dimerization/docking domain-containing protein [Rhodobium gokarnense]|uniref:DUF2946 domain-containing protein n=1 Tax=Rhodobium gokarnense TaxID=364296 RepID=A0ABT3HC94_9HYPH|nr:hypothetical protein [Rhodobium gokarnense]MCW2307990.1 hypothetical protein [Rhodobium gokarnense]
MLAMVLQVLAASEHLAASASLIGSRDGERLPQSLFFICTGNGVARLGPEGQTGDRTGGPVTSCPICTAFALGGTGDVPDVGCLALPDVDFAAIIAVQPADLIVLASAYRRAPARGPPFPNGQITLV